MKKAGKFIIEMGLYLLFLCAFVRLFKFLIVFTAEITGRTNLETAINTLVVFSCIGIASRASSGIMKIWKEAGKDD